MNKVQQITTGAAFLAAQSMAAQVAEVTSAQQHGVSILVAPRDSDNALFYHITTTCNRARETTELLCSATSLQRLTAHAKGFIENLSYRNASKTGS